MCVSMPLPLFGLMLLLQTHFYMLLSANAFGCLASKESDADE